ncbi:unnamed protein product, partial [Choristocarpus tenellus]
MGRIVERSGRIRFQSAVNHGRSRHGGIRDGARSGGGEKRRTVEGFGLSSGPSVAKWGGQDQLKDKAQAVKLFKSMKASSDISRGPKFVGNGMRQNTAHVRSHITGQGKGYSGRDTDDLLKIGLAQSRRRIEFRKASHPSAVFSPGGFSQGVNVVHDKVSHKLSTPLLSATDRSEGDNEASSRGDEEQRLARLTDKTIGLPPPDKGLYPDSLVKAVLSWSKVYRVGPGLNNLGNTCFLNSTLQCLTYLPPLAQHLLTAKYASQGNSSNFFGGQGGKNS